MNKIFFLTCMSTAMLAEKVLIITHVHSRPDLIELQEKTFRAFLEDDYEFVVFDDAPTEKMSQLMKDTCQQLGIRYIRIPQSLHEGRQTPNYRHSDGIKFSLEMVGFNHDGIVFMVDSDMFLIKPLSIKKYMQDYAFIGVRQTRHDNHHTVTYSAPMVVLMNMTLLPNRTTLNFDCGHVEGLACDVGGSSHYYFKNNPSVKIRLFEPLSTYRILQDKQGLAHHDEETVSFMRRLNKDFGMEFHADNNFLHYYAGGSNWPGYPADYHRKKTALLIEYLDQRLAHYKTREEN